MHSFSASSLLSQGTTPAVPADAVYLSGDLPASSILHVALNHLKSFRPPRIDYSLRANQESLHDDTEHIQDDLERKNERKAHVLVLTPSREDLATALAEENDTSLIAGGPRSALHELLDQIEVKYLETSAHYIYCLQTLYTHDNPSSGKAYAAWKSAQPNSPVDPSYLPLMPTLVILHDPSAYLEEVGNQSAESQAYTSLLALFYSTFQSLSSSFVPQLIVFDKHAASISLPVSRPDNPHRNSSPNRSPRTVPRIVLAKLAESLRVFDRFGVVEQVPDSPTAIPTLRRDYIFTLQPPNLTKEVDVQTEELRFYTEREVTSSEGYDVEDRTVATTIVLL